MTTPVRPHQPQQHANNNKRIIRNKRNITVDVPLARFAVTASAPQSPVLPMQMPTPAAAAASDEELQRTSQKAAAAAAGVKSKKCLSKQLSMCETSRDVAWERRRRQILSQERKKRGIPAVVEPSASEDLTDEDLNELKGCIELGFGFNEEKGQHLASTFPALDLYFAVNRQLSPSPVSTPNRRSLERQPQPFDSPKAEQEKDWKICNPGDHPDQVKTKLRHWAQAVACSVMQSY